MKVKELVEILNGMDQDKEVWIMEDVDPWKPSRGDVKETNLEDPCGKDIPVVLIAGW